MRLLVIVVAILAIGFLGAIPVTKQLVTKNEVERELDVAMYEYQTLPLDEFRRRLDRIGTENALGSAGFEARVEETSKTSVAVTIEYRSTLRVFFVPVTREVVLRRTATKLGV